MIKEFKGTYGEWRYCEPLGKVLSVKGVVAALVIDDNANGQLIAAAPDLLKALQFVLPWIPESDGEALHLAETAIKKALG